MFPVTRPHISWLKIHDSSDAAVEDKALDKQYEATRSVLTTIRKWYVKNALMLNT